MREFFIVLFFLVSSLKFKPCTESPNLSTGSAPSAIIANPPVSSNSLASSQSSLVLAAARASEDPDLRLDPEVARIDRIMLSLNRQQEDLLGFHGGKRLSKDQLNLISNKIDVFLFDLASNCLKMNDERRLELAEILYPVRKDKKCRPEIRKMVDKKINSYPDPAKRKALENLRIKGEQMMAEGQG
jgi:hypothetical protein